MNMISIIMKIIITMPIIMQIVIMKYSCNFFNSCNLNLRWLARQIFIMDLGQL